MANLSSAIQNKWPNIKEDIKSTWKNLKDEELEKTKGDFKKIGRLLNKRYADSKGTISQKLNEIYRRFDIQPDSYKIKKSEPHAKLLKK